MGIVGGGASTPHYGTPISRNGTHDAPMEIGSVWGTLDAPIWHLRDTGEWDVEAPSPTVGTHMVEWGVRDAPDGTCGIRGNGTSRHRPLRCVLRKFPLRRFMIDTKRIDTKRKGELQ